jgi:hypothetical protein
MTLSLIGAHISGGTFNNVAGDMTQVFNFNLALCPYQRRSSPPPYGACQPIFRRQELNKPPDRHERDRRPAIQHLASSGLDEPQFPASIESERLMSRGLYADGVYADDAGNCPRRISDDGLHSSGVDEPQSLISDPLDSMFPGLQPRCADEQPPDNVPPQIFNYVVGGNMTQVSYGESGKPLISQ